MERVLEGRTAVLSGAAKTTGLGYAFAKRLAEAGADIVIADMVDGAEAAESLAALGVKARAVSCDVSEAGQVDALARAVNTDFGGCDILFHCASPFSVRPLEDMDFTEWRRILAVNLDGLFLLCKAFVPGMKARRWGRIVPISSATVQAGAAGRTHYMSAKAGMMGFARSLAREVGPFGVTVNVLTPGLVRTERGREDPLPDAQFAGKDKYAILREQQCIDRTLIPDDLAGAALFLASDASAAMTGQTMLVDGGWRHIS